MEDVLAARVDVEALFAEHEQALVADVEPMTVARASSYIDQWRQVALATAGIDDGPEPAGDTGRNQVHLSKTFQGRWALGGDLDAQSGEVLANELNDWIERRVKAGAIDPTDGRCRAGHRADALVALVGAGADRQPGTHQPRARINLSWDADDLLGRDIANLAEVDRHRCNTGAGTTLAFEAADQLMCNAEIIDLLVRFGYHTTGQVSVTRPDGTEIRAGTDPGDRRAPGRRSRPHGADRGMKLPIGSTKRRARFASTHLDERDPGTAPGGPDGRGRAA